MVFTLTSCLCEITIFVIRIQTLHRAYFFDFIAMKSARLYTFWKYTFRKSIFPAKLCEVPGMDLHYVSASGSNAASG